MKLLQSLFIYWPLSQLRSERLQRDGYIISHVCTWGGMQPSWQLLNAPIYWSVGNVGLPGVLVIVLWSSTESICDVVSSSEA